MTAKKDDITPHLHRGVTVKLPSALHPSMPIAHGVISQPHNRDNPELTDVALYPNDMFSNSFRTRVPHVSKATEKSGWWRYGDG